MTAKKQSGATPRKFDEEYRREAVRLWRTSGQAAEVTAQQLGISVFNLYKWGREGEGTRRPGFLRPPESKEALQAEVVRLQLELARMTEQRDILKKAAGILSEPSPRGMPGSKR